MMYNLWLLVISSAIFCSVDFTVGFQSAARQLPKLQIISTPTSQSRLFMGWGDILNKAFANEAMPPPKNPGLSKDPDPVMVEFLPSKKTIKAFPGQSVSTIAQSAGVDIKYSCKKGECGTCMINFDGSIVKACKTSIPAATKQKTFTIGVLPPKSKANMI